ncbi:MAG TPA: hypothetical protein VKN99_10445 [Polyangia bacterium]|nr:hypothetical protein [Polyangia bacterium]
MRHCALSLFLVFACSKAQSAPTPVPSTAKKYTLDVDAPKEVKVGAKSSFRIVIKPAAGFHINQEFPLEIALSAPDVKLGKDRLAKPDAKPFSEGEARFEVDFSAAKPGLHDFSARARFAVCTDKDCWPVRDGLTWKVLAN